MIRFKVVFEDGPVIPVEITDCMMATSPPGQLADEIVYAIRKVVERAIERRGLAKKAAP